MSISTQLINTLFVPICLFSITFCNVSKYYPISKYNSTVPPFFGIRYPLVGNLLYQVTKTSYLMIPSSNCVIPTSQWQFFCYICWFPYFFLHLTVQFLHCIVPTSHVIIFLSHLVVPFFFLLTFDDFILTLCSSNITYDCSFVTFGGSFFFSSHIWRFHPHIV